MGFEPTHSHLWCDALPIELHVPIKPFWASWWEGSVYKSSVEHIPHTHAASYVYPVTWPWVDPVYLAPRPRARVCMLMIFTDILIWTYVHEQRAHVVFVTLVGLANPHSEASFSLISTDSSHLRVAQMSRCVDLAISVTTTCMRAG